MNSNLYGQKGGDAMITKSIPSMLTLGNLFLGMMAIILTLHGEPRYLDYAAILIIIGMVLDGLDGMMARMLNAASDFGKELDSLSDIVTFGVAPAIVIYSVSLNELGAWGVILTALFPICGAVRLARFSVRPGIPGFFVGLPITAAGGVLATFSLYHEVFPPAFLPGGILILSFLMVSRIKYPNFKKVGVPRAALWVTPLMIGAVVLLAYAFPEEFPRIVFIPLVLYAVYGVKKSVDSYLRKRRRENREKKV
jgi:CDP-diacylglycerol---serine O-phosphatidyltransferase